MFRCNKCWKKLGNNASAQAYVTICSHMFCLECGERFFSKKFVCPGCDKTLNNNGEVQIVDLNPSEEFRTISLCGLDPETIMEMCARGLSFFAYQKQNEIAYLSFLNRKAQQKMQQLEKGFDDRLDKANNAITVLNGQIRALKEELESGKKDYRDLQEKFTEKTRQKRKLEELFDSLKQKYDTFVRNKKGHLSPFIIPKSISPLPLSPSSNVGKPSPGIIRGSPTPVSLPRNFPTPFSSSSSHSPSLPLGGVSGRTADRSSVSSSSSVSSPYSVARPRSSLPLSPLVISDSSYATTSPYPGPVRNISNVNDRWQRIKDGLKINYSQNPLRRPGTPLYAQFLKGKTLEE